MGTFLDAWSTEIWPTIQPTYEELLITRPATQDAATGGHYGTKVLTHIGKKREVRNVTCNLTYTDPKANTALQTEILFDSVARFALDTFVDTAWAMKVTLQQWVS